MPGPGSRQDTGKDRPFILHLSGDFPDSIEPFKTRAIEALLELTQESFDHHVVSINRVNTNAPTTLKELLRTRPLLVESQPFNTGTALSYEAPAKGVRHRSKLQQLGDWLAGYIEQLDRKPDLIVGHKLSIEGIAVQRASQTTGIPYALSIQGNTDTKIIKFRKDLRLHFAEVLTGAVAVFPFAPWALEQVQDYLGVAPKHFELVPCPTELDSPRAPTYPGTGVVSVFHLKNHDDKNFAKLVEAQAVLASRRAPPKIEIVGGGSDADWAACRSIVGDTPGIELVGGMERDAVANRLNEASVMVMPSRRETFGLVFIEALFAGTPIIYPKGRAVDGYFDDCGFALGVDANSAESIADAIAYALANEEAMKTELQSWLRGEEAERFTRPEIAGAFTRGLNQALGHA